MCRVRGGRDRDDARVVTSSRMKLVATKHHCMKDQNSRCTERPLRSLGGAASLLDCVGGPFGAALVRSRITLVRIISPSHISHGSESLLATISPIISSENSWPTSATRQSFSRSSVGRRMARTPWTRSWRYAASFWACSSIVLGDSGLGIGERAGRGHREW